MNGTRGGNSTRQWRRTLKRVAGYGIPVLALAVSAAYGLHADSIFELGPGLANPDGTEANVTNILGDGVAGNGPDWADLFKVNPDGTVSVDAAAVASFGGNAAAFVQDDVSAGNLTDRTVYAGKTSDKNNYAIAQWDWGTSSVPSKDDLTNAYAYARINGSGQLMIYAGAEREDPSGASHIDLEFFQNQVGLDEAPPCDKPQCFFTGTKKPGDVLVSMDFNNGGALGSVTIRRRNAANDGYDVVTSLNGTGCNAGDTVCAFNNGAPIDGGPWRNFDNHAAEITTLPTNAFTEFGMNVTALLGSTPCFSTVQFKTRSSPSFSAELKDFALANFQSCTASAQTQIHAGASVGATHTAADIQGTTLAAGNSIHDKATVTGTIGFPAPTGTVTFQRFGTANCTGSALTSETVTLTVVQAGSPGVAGVSAAESQTVTPAAGSTSYLATYNGDTNYPSAVDAACEPLTVAKTNSAVTTDIRENSASGASVMNTAVSLGTVVVDVATVSGSASLGDPTGTVTFRRYINGGCSGTFTDEVVTIVADSNPTDGIATVTSAQQTMNSSDGSFLSYAVSYSGDSRYNGFQTTVCEPVCQLNKTTQQQP